MMQRLGVVVIAWVCGAGTARADELGPGEKSVKLAILVEATVPAGKALILANTFQGADVVVPGQDTAIDWHPMIGGDMQLVLVDAGDTARLTALRSELKRDEIKAIVDRGVACGAKFRGIRTLPDSSSATRVRWSFKVGFAGGGCTAQPVAVEHLDEGGKQVSPDAGPKPPITPPVLQQSEPTRAPVEAPAKQTAPAPVASGGCNTTPPTPGLGGLVLAGLLLRRRRG